MEVKKNRHSIILINGKRRSGKGLLSKAIATLAEEKDYKGNVYILSFAQAIKKITESILVELKWDGENKEIVRPLWIAMGEVGRNIDNNIWCSRVMDKIREIIKEVNKQGKNSLFLIDDLRFPNELDFFKGSLAELQQIVGGNANVSVNAIRIQKFFDATKFVPGVDDNSTETSFDKIVNLCFDHIIPENILIDQHWTANFEKVNMYAKIIYDNYLAR
ncbi:MULTISPECIES: hypothetical protein [unclassified Mycoplasma]|uniref:hypothetical protein n=1 Tax=unclassified Mycoplasma TaxID=2683645 RepID=UPI00211D016F|nr:MULTISPECIES: hypothetical protein [unclassified Mycoplasma]UUM20136.1 hypothetical protein NPA11_01785 [Mycoplasma sp. 1578d]UUM25116.1 hypothetical protein NPA12_01760 [Mycoplasma sp. 3686d]